MRRGDTMQRSPLLGIKGQYILLDTGVLNMRKFAGYAVTLTV
jgi:hypothetical protein